MTPINEIVVFCGSSVSISEAKGLLPSAIFPGPIRRGDLGKQEASLICIIDGFFLQNLAVSPAEIMETLRQGRQVWGAASMGALRAAECDRFGMRGVGDVYRMYRDGILVEDDEVAVSISPDDFTPQSDALVDVRAFLKSAVSEQLLSTRSREQIERHLKSNYFADRSFEGTLRHLTRDQLLEESSVGPLISRYRTEPKLKHQDAILCLREAKRFLEEQG